MHKRLFFSLVYSFIFVFFIFSGLGSSAFADNFKIKNILPDNSGKLLTINGTNNSSAVITNESELTDPDRAVIDLQNSILIGQKCSIDIAESGIKNIKIAQFSTNPNIVRLVFTADSSQDLKNLSINKSQNSVVFKLVDFAGRE